jgi:hypothetical protein
MAHVIETNKARRKPERPMSDSDDRPPEGSVTVVSLGTGSDIASILNLVPDVDVIFMIDEHDDSKEELSELYEKIKKIITEGRCASDARINTAVHLAPMPIVDKSPYHYLSKGKGEIIADARYRERDPAIKWDWRLRFRYGGKQRVLMRFEQSPLKTWPVGISGAQHVMLHHDEHPIDLFDLKDGLPTDQRVEFFLNFDTCTHRHGYRIYGRSHVYPFPRHVVVECGADPRGSQVAYANVMGEESIKSFIQKYTHKYWTPASLTLDVLSTGKTYKVKWSKWVITPRVMTLIANCRNIDY